MKSQKSRLVSLLAASALGLSVIPPLLADTPFTYQGRLDVAGQGYNGSVTLKLVLWQSSTLFGSPIRSEVVQGVPVTNGLFSVTATTFQAADFGTHVAGEWLEIDVSTDGGTTYTPLTPFQRVSHAPLALTAERAKSLVGTLPASQISGNLPASQLSGTMSPAIIGNGSISGSISFTPASGAPFAVGNTIKITNLNADLLDGLDSTAFLRTVGGTLTGTLSVPNSGTQLDFGSNTRQMINLWGGGDFGIGVQTATLYQRSNTNFAWFRGGAHNDAALAPGNAGSSLMTLSDSLLMLRPDVTNSISGQGPIRIGFGDSNNGIPYVSVGEGDTDDQMDLRASKINLATSSGAGTSLSFGATTGQHLVLFENASDTYGVGVQSSTEYFRSGNQFAWYKDGVHSDTELAPGTGGSTLMSLVPASNGTSGSLVIPGGGNLTIGGASVTNAAASVSLRINADSQLYYTTGGTYLGGLNNAGNLYLAGSLSTTVLTIRGGADVAEPFEMTDSGEMEPGSVVVIDEEHPGKLRLSSEACDTRVAGIISGAGGVKPGLRLHQEGVMEGDHHVALSGRVYVKADNSGGAIQPGDLLTTSPQKGHAMKVIDHDRSQGAILGKAMSRLDESTDLVLVLVTLQ